MNKGVLKPAIMALATVMAFSTQAMADATQKADLYVSSGFPYENLVQRFDTVKIHYVEAEESLRCRVELISGAHSTINVSQTITEKQFNHSPLKSCISRKEAVAALATTY